MDLDPSCTLPFSKLTESQKQDADRESKCDVMKRLRQIPTIDVTHMQEVIAKYAHKMQYSLRDGVRSDAFEVLLTKIHEDLLEKHAKRIPEGQKLLKGEITTESRTESDFRKSEYDKHLQD